MSKKAFQKIERGLKEALEYAQSTTLDGEWSPEGNPIVEGTEKPGHLPYDCYRQEVLDEVLRRIRAARNGAYSSIHKIEKIIEEMKHGQ